MRKTAPLKQSSFMLIFVGTILLSMSLGAALATLITNFAGIGTSSVDMMAFIREISTHRYGWYILITSQAVSHLCSYLLPACICLYWVERACWNDFQRMPFVKVRDSWVGLLVVITFIPFNETLIHWNERIELPETFQLIEQWMQSKEQVSGFLMQLITSFESIHQLIIALLIIGVLASLGEEVFFRGVVQRKLVEWTGSTHAGIWLSAILFSAAHLQFYGFFPRLFLGALFGYLYVWSGNLWIAVLAHMINNSMAVLSSYFQLKLSFLNRAWQFDAETWFCVTVSLLVSAWLLNIFYRSNQKAVTYQNSQ